VAAAGDAGLQAMLAGGDDYELCFTAPPPHRERIALIARAQAIALTRIGRVSAGAPEVRVVDAGGAPVPIARRGFDHFAQ
jgi:thiamine-monophosphate kinase